MENLNKIDKNNEFINIERAIEIGIQAGIKEALNRIKSENDKKSKMKRTKRYHNTELLLRNYNELIKHYKDAVYSSNQVENEDAEDPNELLAELEEYDEYEIYINSIKRTKTRTRIILKHINLVMEFYKQKSLVSNDETMIRRYEVINKVYIEKKKYADIAEELDCSEKTIARDKHKAIEELSVLFFGIDGIKFTL